MTMPPREPSDLEALLMAGWDQEQQQLQQQEQQEPEQQAEKATVPQTCIIILSIFMGLGMLSQPYGLRIGGWAALAPLATVGFLFFISATLLSKACALLPHDQPRTFPSLGTSLGGAHGRRFVAVMAGLELSGMTVITFCIVFQQLQILLPTKGFFSTSSPQLSVAITAAGIFPLLALPDISRLSALSIAGSAASALVALSVLCLLPLDPARQHVHQPPAFYSAIRWPGIMQSFGIFAVSMSGHSTLPALRTTMRHPERFPTALAYAFGVMAAVYAAVAGIGYWYFGDQVSALLTFDLATASPYVHPGSTSWMWRAFSVDRVLASLVLVACSAKLPALVMVVEKLVIELVRLDASRKTEKVQFVFRLGVAAAGLGVAAAAQDHLGSVLSLVGGGCSISTSFLLPVLFYARLTWSSQSKLGKVALGGLFVIGLVLLGEVVSVALQSMLANHRAKASGTAAFFSMDL